MKKPNDFITMDREVFTKQESLVNKYAFTIYEALERFDLDTMDFYDVLAISLCETCINVIKKGEYDKGIKDSNWMTGIIREAYSSEIINYFKNELEKRVIKPEQGKEAEKVLHRMFSDNVYKENDIRCCHEKNFNKNNNPYNAPTGRFTEYDIFNNILNEVEIIEFGQPISLSSIDGEILDVLRQLFN